MTKRDPHAFAEYRRILQEVETIWPMDEPGLTIEASQALLHAWPYETDPILHSHLLRRHRALLDRVHIANTVGRKGIHRRRRASSLAVEE